jgi:hypothetical protein
VNPIQIAYQKESRPDLHNHSQEYRDYLAKILASAVKKEIHDYSIPNWELHTAARQSYNKALEDLIVFLTEKTLDKSEEIV